MNKVYFGDARDSLRILKDQGIKVKTCITSPPYFGLRDYGHEGQIGLEETWQEYVANLVEVFRLVRDVLADDGTLWLNLGDSYVREASKGQHKPEDRGKQQYIYASGGGRASNGMKIRLGSTDGYTGRADQPDHRCGSANLKPKDMLGIPWRVAFALQDDDWYLRQDIIWHKPNPMPESVQDRCTKAHEYLFLLSKNERYYFDSEAIQEQADVANFRESSTARRESPPGASTDSGFLNGRKYEKRNKRSVWSIATQPYSGAHFACFPPALIEPCVMAGSGKGDIVLDPFFGSGTTGEVAQKLGRQYIGCEIQAAYKELQDRRLSQQSLCL